MVRDRRVFLVTSLDSSVRSTRPLCRNYLFWFSSCPMASVSPWPVVDERPRPRTLPWPWHHGRSGDVLGQGHTTTTAVANWRWGNHIFSWLFAPRGPFLNLTPSLSLLNTIRFFYYLATKSLVYKIMWNAYFGGSTSLCKFVPGRTLRSWISR